MFKEFWFPENAEKVLKCLVSITSPLTMPPLPLPLGRLEDYMNTGVSIRHASNVVRDKCEYYYSSAVWINKRR